MPNIRFERMTYRLQGGCSTPELIGQNQQKNDKGGDLKRITLNRTVDLSWMREKDSNLRPLAYEANELPTATIPQYSNIIKVLCQSGRPRTGIFLVPNKVDVHLSPRSDKEL